MTVHHFSSYETQPESTGDNLQLHTLNLDTRHMRAHLHNPVSSLEERVLTVVFNPFCSRTPPPPPDVISLQLCTSKRCWCII
jgi:hypothetical protein